MKKQVIKNLTNEELTNRKELILPTDVSVGLKALTVYETGTLSIKRNTVETLSGDGYRFFEYGVERNIDKLGLSKTENPEKVWNGIRTIPIEGMNFNYRIDSEGMSISMKSVMLLNNVDFWDVLWNGYVYYYYHTDHKIFCETGDKMYEMIYKKEYNVNTITMDDIDNYTLPR
jgi:hypothetical protein